jgi:UDP-GlcNAc:undecaprenyl-phosphate/decaprenyl-phosphate GlcNAc-1-phosphate transferase
MLPALALAACSFILAFLLTPLLRDLARSRGWVDKPDNDRKLHQGPIPRIGGIAIVVAYCGSFAVLLSLGLPKSTAINDALPFVLNLLPAAAVVFATGLLDDIVGLSPWQKLTAEILAAVVACSGGIQIHGIAYHPISPYLGVPLTVVWLVGCANAFNLIDGLDGVATGLGLLATLTTLGAALLHGAPGLVIAMAPLAGALLGFLRYNFNPASVFLGDCGSLTVGFTLGCCAVMWSHKSATVLGMAAPLMALCIPLRDMSLSILRRFLVRRPIFSADRGHIHHRLLDRGLTPRRVALLLYGASGLAACFSLLQSTLKDAGIVVTVLFCGVVCSGIQFLRYYEFGIAATLWRQKNLRSIVGFHCSMYRYEESVRAAKGVEQYWDAIRTLGAEFGFSHVALRLGGVTYQEDFGEITQRYWILQVPLSDSEYVRFISASELSKAPLAIAPLADLLIKSLASKSSQHAERLRVGPNKAMTAASVMHG